MIKIIKLKILPLPDQKHVKQKLDYKKDQPQNSYFSLVGGAIGVLRSGLGAILLKRFTNLSGSQSRNQMYQCKKLELPLIMD
jgi:hypothetical protein